MSLIPSLRQKRGQIINQMSEIVTLASREGRTMTVDEITRYDTLKTDANNFLAQITRHEESERLMAEASVPMVPGEMGRATVTRDQADKREKGFALSRIVRALAATKGNVRDAALYCEQTFRDAEVAKALAAGVGSAGGFLVPEDYSNEIIEFLRPMSVVRAMGAVELPMPKGNLTIPKQTGGASANYIGENVNIPPSEPTFGQLRLTARKLAALTPISNDLIRFSSPAADAVVRNDLVAAIAQAEDLNFIRGLGTGAGPKGLRYWAPAANVIAVNATVNLANVTQDLGKLWLALREANTRMLRLGYLMAPRTENYLRNLRDGNGNKAFPEMERGLLNGYPFKSTTQIPVNLAVTGTNESEIYLVDFADAIIAQATGLIIDVSDTAAYHDGSNVVATFSLDQTVIRVIAEHDFGMRHEGSVAVLKDVDWV
jgi:HK97 family phage major capsid protein